MLHVGDAYYLRVETERDDHPVSRLTAQRADDDRRRLASLEEIRRLQAVYETLIRRYFAAPLSA